MSGKLESQVWELKLKQTHMVVLKALCDSADDFGKNCYPSPLYLAHKTGASLSTIYRVLESFERDGWIESVGHKGNTTEYAIHLERVPRKPPFKRRKAGRPRKTEQQRDAGAQTAAQEPIEQAEGPTLWQWLLWPENRAWAATAKMPEKIDRYTAWCELQGLEPNR